MNRSRTMTFLLMFVLLAGQAQAQELNRKEEDAFYVAVKSYQDGFYDVAISLFDRFIKEYGDPQKKLEALVYIGQCYFAQEKYLKALEHFETLLKMDGAEPVRDRLLFWLGEVYVKGRDYRRAAELYRELIAKYEKSSYYLSAHFSLALAYLAERRYEDAVSVYRDVLARYPDTSAGARAAFGICEVLYRKGDYETLKKELAAFLERYSSARPGADQAEDIDRALFYLAEADFYLGDFTGAEKAYKACLDQAGSDELRELARIGLGWSHLKDKDYEKAREVFAAYGEDAPLSVVLGRAVVALEDGSSEDALALYDKVIAADKQGEFLPLAYFGRAESLYHLSRFQEAIVSYRVSLDKLKSVFRGLADNRELRDKIYYGLAWSYLKIGDFPSAQEAFQKVVTLTTDKIFKLSALCQLADTYLDTGEYDKAIAGYKNFLELYPDSVYNDYIQFQLGVAWLRSENADAAILAFRKLLSDFPSSKLVDDARYYLSVTYFQKGLFEAARRELEAFANGYKDSPFRPQALFLIAECWMNEGKYRQALEFYQAVRQQYPQEAALRQKAEYETAHAVFEMGQMAQAQRLFLDFVTRYPDSPFSPNVLFWLGQSLAAQEDYAGARRAFERLIRNYPHHEGVADAYLGIGRAYAAEGASEAALRSFEQVLGDAGSAPAARAMALAAMGDIFMAQGNGDRAKELFRQAAAIPGPWVKTSYVKLARLYAGERDADAAAQALSQARAAMDAIQDGAVLWEIGEIYEAIGRPKDAVGAYMQIYYLLPHDPLAVKALLRVAQIYEDRSSRPELRKILEVIASLDVPEAAYARERLKKLESSQGASKP
ncbi:MAG: tetratricopeptide repeat protein [Deltaproteobacteria bacterium]